MELEDGFQLVRRKKGKHKTNSLKRNLPTFESERPDSGCAFNKDLVFRRVCESRDELKTSFFYQTFYGLFSQNVGYLVNGRKTTEISSNGEEVNCSVQVSSGASSQHHCCSTLTCDQNHKQTYLKGRDGNESFHLNNLHSCSDGVTGESDRAPKQLDLLVYGIGNFASCLIARYQLALIVALRDQLHLPHTQCHIYDPVFTQVEKDVLESLYFSLIPLNEEGKRKCARPTIVFMPHCGKALYNNLLWTNWSQSLLTNFVVIGNSFSHMEESLVESSLKKEAHYILRISPFTFEIKIPNNFKYSDIFNNTSLHIFHHQTLCGLGDEFWDDQPEPCYDDNVEITLNR